jgi:hypothetical protein
LLVPAEVRKLRLAAVPALLPVFRVPGETPADGAEERTAEPVLEINTAQLRAAKIWAHNIARKVFKRSSPDEASFRLRNRT